MAASATKKANEAAVQTLADELGIPYRSRAAQSYSEEDKALLADAALSVHERAARLGRSYNETIGSIRHYGLAL